MTTYTIKPLVWKRTRRFGHERLKADTLLGRFIIRVMNDAFGIETPDNGCLDCDSIEDGKTKAEAHYRERLMAALKPVKP